MEISAIAARALGSPAEEDPAVLHREILAGVRAVHRQRPLRLLLPQAGERFRDGPPVHPWPELFLQLAGERRFTSGGSTLVAEPGDVVLVPRGTPHQERTVDRGRGSACLVWMCFSGRLSLHTATAKRGALERMGCNNLYADDQGAGSDRLCDELAVTLRDGADERTSTALLDVVLSHALACANGRSLLLGGHLTLLDRCLRLLPLHLHEPSLSVSRLADELGCHPDHLGRIFRQAIGTTLVAHIARRRIDLASDLLVEGRVGVREVARACGFRDASYFSRMFRRIRGESPRAFLRRRPGITG